MMIHTVNKPISACVASKSTTASQQQCPEAGSLADLHEVGDILAHSLHCLRAAERAVGRHVNALLVAPFQHSVIPPVCMHLNLNMPENLSLHGVMVEYGDETGRGAMEAARKGRLS
jgi:hypothetical protein